MRIETNELFHVYNQGNNKNQLFFEPADYEIFLLLYKKYVMPRCETFAYCLMPNHFHFLIYTNQHSTLPVKLGPVLSCEVANAFRVLQSRFAQIINSKYKRTGSLFRQKAKAKSTTENNLSYAFAVIKYIHDNPLKAGLVSSPEEWDYSSYGDYCGHHREPICNTLLASSMLEFCLADLRGSNDYKEPEPGSYTIFAQNFVSL